MGFIRRKRKPQSRSVICDKPANLGELRLLPDLPMAWRTLFFQRHDISRLPQIEADKPARKAFKSYRIGYFHIGITKVRSAEGKNLPVRGYRAHFEVCLRAPARKCRYPGRPQRLCKNWLARCFTAIRAVLMDRDIEFDALPSRRNGLTARAAKAQV